MAFPEHAIFHQPSEVFAPEHKTGGPPHGSAGPETPQQQDQATENLSMLSLTQKDSTTDNLSLPAEHEHTERSLDEVRAMGQFAQSLEATVTFGEGQALKGEGIIDAPSVVGEQELATEAHSVLQQKIDKIPESLEHVGTAQPTQGDLFFDYSKLPSERMTRAQAEEFCNYWVEFKRRLGNPDDAKHERTTQEEWDQYHAELARHEETLKQHWPEILRQWKVVERVHKFYPTLWRKALKHYLNI
jgi:hypothetical protein